MIILLYALLFASTLSQGYDTKLSIELAYMSLVTFEPLDQISSWTCGPCQNYQVQDVLPFLNVGQSIHQYNPRHTRLCRVQSNPPRYHCRFQRFRRHPKLVGECGCHPSQLPSVLQLQSSQGILRCL